ncbi:MAG: hypothetical protein ABJV68_06875 [Paracoccaceae bacterium]
MTDTTKGPDYVAYSVKDRGADKDAAWNRVGAAWQHRDGKGYDLQLDATPVDGRVTLREQKRSEYKEKRREEAQSHAPSRGR